MKEARRPGIRPTWPIDGPGWSGGDKGTIADQNGSDGQVIAQVFGRILTLIDPRTVSFLPSTKAVTFKARTTDSFSRLRKRKQR